MLEEIGNHHRYGGDHKYPEEHLYIGGDNCGKNLEITETYVKPEMDVIEISSEYALVTTGCGSCTFD